MRNSPTQVQRQVAQMEDDGRRMLWDENSGWWTGKYTTREDPDYQDIVLPFIGDVFLGAERVIDLGGGEGRLSRYLMDKNKCEVVCVDFSHRQLKTGYSKNFGPSYVQSDIARLPFEAGVFDSAVACLVFEHALELLETIEEASRVLRPDGKFVIVLNHPAMQTPESGFVFDHEVDPPSKYWRISDYLVEVSHFEEVEKGIFLPFEHRPISKYINSLIEAGFTIERLYEPPISDRYVEGNPEFSNVRYIPRLLLIVCSN